MSELHYLLTAEQYATLKDHLRKEVRQELRDRIALLDPESPLLVILDRADDNVCGEAADTL